jgi:7-cyano-7-deazaguanine synthase
MTTALVVLSGGQDSTTCLAWALAEFDTVHCISFDYGQRHAIELESAKQVAKLAGVSEERHHFIKVTALAEIGGAAMLAGVAPKEGETVGSETSSGLPNTFLPGRNLIFLTLASALAYKLGISDLVTGVCQTDYSGYPDCRLETIQQLEHAITLGMSYDINIHTPLMDLTKAESVDLAMELAIAFGSDVPVQQMLAHSHTCYNGLFPPCGACPACELRLMGFKEAGVVDPVLTRAFTDKGENIPEKYNI